ncbi:MAG TPA: 16S rRNA (cytosine(1402)-N(4))-methyltransferase RsmH [Thermomicrobiales bacterium]|nr:16S rRNA (cytosine(1402)-N(4))-methyltransferase RsmH [Thermomicrobiales bacterium]
MQETNGMEPAMPGGMPVDADAIDPGHASVLASEAVDALMPRPGGVFVDGTFGGGGHARLLIERIQPGGRIICIDRDASTCPHFDTLDRAHPGALIWAQGTYSDMRRFAQEAGVQQVDGVLLDLGLSSLQLADAERGFSFLREGPLDMRFDTTRGVSAADLLAQLTEPELARVLFEYGEESQARRIARAVVRERKREPIATTTRLAGIVQRAIGQRPGSRIHPATRTFQALRIAVNDELGEVERGVAAGIDLLAPRGRFAVISFHSLEDRIVKRAFAAAARGCVCPREAPVCVCGREPAVRLVGRATRPSAGETERNPRARSAMLRVVERLS